MARAVTEIPKGDLDGAAGRTPFPVRQYHYSLSTKRKGNVARRPVFLTCYGGGGGVVKEEKQNKNLL